MSDWPRNQNGESDAYGDGMDSSIENELAAVGRDLRAVLVREPEPEVAEAHIAAILAEAERVAAAGTEGRRPTFRRRLSGRRALTVRLAAVVVSAFVASAGLALAGVRPPEPFSDIFEGVGFDVPGSDQPDTPEADPSSSTSGSPGSVPGAGAMRGSDARDTAAGALNLQRSVQGEEASAEDRETAEEARSGAGPPSEPGRSEEHTSAPSFSPSQDLTVDPGVAQGQVNEVASGLAPTAGGSSGVSPPGGGQDPPRPLVTPDVQAPPGTPASEAGATQGATTPGAAVSGEHRPTPDAGETAPVK